MGQVLVLSMRTTLVSLLCIAMWLLSGKIFNFLPAILFFPVLILYYQQAMLWYFVISSDDIFSSVLGIIFSISFIILYIINISVADTIFVKSAGVLGIIIGFAQTAKSFKIRRQGGFYNA